MWEAIERNSRQSRTLIVLMWLLLGALGGSIGATYGGVEGGVFGLLLASAVWLLLWLVAIWQGESILLASAGAKKIEKQDAPQLWNVVEEMTIAAGLGRMPDVYVIAEDHPNAFAVGRKPERRAVAVTSSLLRLLSRDELQGVIGHEIGHLVNRDTAFMTLAGVMLGAIVLLSDLFLRSLRYGGRRSGRSKGGAIILLMALVLAILAPILARILYLACSRMREYLADACGARFTRYPEGLASALEKISGYPNRPKEINRALAPMYIVNPMEAFFSRGLFSTHPPVEQRVKVLRSIAGGAAYANYEVAFRKVFGDKEKLIGARTLSADQRAVPVRAASAEPAAVQQPAERSREVLDLLGRLSGLVLLTCACGVGIRVPAQLKRDTIPCPKCGRENRVPLAEGDGSAGAPAEGTRPPPKKLRYRRRTKGWESFKCACGQAIQLSPNFLAPAINCRGCGSRIELLSEASGPIVQ